MNRIFEFGNNFIEAAGNKVRDLKISENVGSVVGAITGVKSIGSAYEINGRLYTVQRLIAEGGFGFVYQVRDDYNQIYALKRMILQDKERFAAIKNEIDVMQRFRNSNIVKLEGYKITENPERREIEVLMLMELCSGGSVLDIMNARTNRKLEEREILAIFHDVCMGVLEMHSQSPPIAHRDLKIENVLLCEQTNRYKICDFGSATTRTFNTKQDQERNRAEDDINLFTTLFYRPPEMVDLYRGDIINEKVDIWALGCLLFKMAYYADPFDGGSLQIINNNYKIPENSRFSDRLNGLIQSLLITSPVERPSIFDVCNRLSELKGGPKKVYTQPPRVNSSNSLSSSSNSTPSGNNSPILSSHQSIRNSNNNSPVNSKKLFDLLDSNSHSTPNQGSTRSSPNPVRHNQPIINQQSNNNNNSFGFNDGFDDFDAWGHPSMTNSNGSVPLPNKPLSNSNNVSPQPVTNNHKNNDGFGDLFSNVPTPQHQQQQQPPIKKVQPQQQTIKTSNSSMSDLEGLNWTTTPSNSTKTSSSSVGNNFVSSQNSNPTFEFGDFESFNNSPSSSTKNHDNSFNSTILTPTTSNSSSPMNSTNSFNHTMNGSGGHFNSSGSGSILQPMNSSPLNNSPNRTNFYQSPQPQQPNLFNQQPPTNNMNNNFKPNYNIDLNSFTKTNQSPSSSYNGINTFNNNSNNQKGVQQQQQQQKPEQKVLNFDIFK
ncbi:putative protein serine/threonine kinase [Tieghemostelium lacteum]|uniref:non-specific serine/threonine protein kinase n=1 Tax=Tieghemostelium lacteum TaxID=361077 RepID=A0A151Z6H0_TIELA|nr:putative protein serine/threonine kinase [Tieghemostelium lacteum]|eukprot:KYQ89550.1 putative protein serine/threonine kinase [Tieghemostelium lacteum]